MLTSATCDVIPRIVVKQKVLAVDYIHARFGRQGPPPPRHTNPSSPRGKQVTLRGL